MSPPRTTQKTQAATADPLEHWKGAFGQDYIKRNEVLPGTAKEAATVFDRILGSAGVKGRIRSVLEVGANVGINLVGLRRVLGPKVALSALEPNPAACKRLRNTPGLNLKEVFQAEAGSIPAGDGAYDLVFTNGVLIHIPPSKLSAAVAEIQRVSKRYILASEYFSHSPMEIPYRGLHGLLWKRDFGRAHLEADANLKTKGYGFLWQQEFPHFDDLNWWLFEKP